MSPNVPVSSRQNETFSEDASTLPDLIRRNSYRSNSSKCQWLCSGWKMKQPITWVEAAVSTPRSKIPLSFESLKIRWLAIRSLSGSPSLSQSLVSGTSGNSSAGPGPRLPTIVENRSSFVPTPFWMCTSTMGRVTRFGKSGVAAPRTDAPAATTPIAAKHNAAATHNDARPAAWCVALVTPSPASMSSRRH